jgi:hypothetical protein
MKTCSACGKRARKRTRAAILEGGKMTPGLVCGVCARQGLLVVCGEPHLTMAPPKKRKPRGLAAALVSLVLLVGCGGVASKPLEGPPVPLAEGGPVRVEERDASDGGHPIECTPDAEAHTGILCMHPKRERGSDGGAHP